MEHATINRWVVKYSPPLAEAFHRRTRPVWVSWRMDETYINVTGHWSSLDRAVDTTGQTLDFLLTEQRNEHAARRFLTTAIRRHGVPEKSTIDGSEANDAAIKSSNQEPGTSIDIRQINYRNHLIEPDHRGVKRVTRPMLGFNSFEAAQSTLGGIELMPMLRKGQLADGGDKGLTLAEPFYALASYSPHRRGLLTSNRFHTKNCDRTAGGAACFNSLPGGSRHGERNREVV